MTFISQSFETLLFTNHYNFTWWEIAKWHHNNVTKWISGDRLLETYGEVTMSVVLWQDTRLQFDVTRGPVTHQQPRWLHEDRLCFIVESSNDGHESRSVFIVMSLGDSSQSNCQCDVSVETPCDIYLRAGL